MLHDCGISSVSSLNFFGIALLVLLVPNANFLCL